MERAGQFVSFEWIGYRNYLGEKIPPNRTRTRGANFTSADAAVRFEHKDGLRQLALIEWKYTESYGSTSVQISKAGTDKLTIYLHLLNKSDCLLNKDLLPDYGSLFFEPFYQLMRQQLLAHEMEKAHELGAKVVSLLHIAPAHNEDFRRITSPGLKCLHLGESATDVWKKLVLSPDRFTSVSTENLFGQFPVEKFPELATWGKYIAARYPWVRAT